MTCHLLQVSVILSPPNIRVSIFLKQSMIVFVNANLPVWSLSEPPDIQNWFSSYVYESPKVDTIQNFVLPYHEKEFDDKVYMNGDNGCGEPQNLRNSLGSGFIHDDKYEHLPVSKVLLICLVLYFNFLFLSPFDNQYFVKSCF